jgi:hypothetical protein
MLLLVPALLLGCSDAMDAMAPVSALGSSKEFRVKQDILQLRAAVDQHFALRGAWPPDWQTLKKKQRDPWGEEYVLEYDDDGPIIFSMGPDREAGTADDIHGAS